MNGRGTRGEWRKGKRYDGEEGVAGWRGLPSPQRGTTRTTFHSATPRAARGARDKRRLGGKGKAGGGDSTPTHPLTHHASPAHLCILLGSGAGATQFVSRDRRDR